jgi:5-methylcytosine-specific restriction endonuclease McrA
MSAAENQRLYDRSNPEYAQAKGHNQRVKERYPQAWAASTITNATLTEWVLEHKGKKCVYCDNPALEIDHKIPLSRGGEHSIGAIGSVGGSVCNTDSRGDASNDGSNLQMLCLPCNRSKHDLTDEEFRGVRPHLLVEEVEIPTGPRFAVPGTAPGTGVPPEITLDNIEEVKELYFKIGDPTEYRAAQGILGSADAWGKALEQEWLLKAVRAFRLELRAKLKSEAIDRLLSISNGGTSGALAAIKTLVTDDYLYTSYLDYGEVEAKRSVGRPVNGVYVEVIPQDVLNEDAARVGLSSSPL